jgi:hypothetical protein
VYSTRIATPRGTPEIGAGDINDTIVSSSRDWTAAPVSGPFETSNGSVRSPSRSKIPDASEGVGPTDGDSAPDGATAGLAEGPVGDGVFVWQDATKSAKVATATAAHLPFKGMRRLD